MLSPVIVSDSNGNFLHVNKKAAALLGYKRKELVGMNLRHIYPEKELKRILKDLSKIRAGEIHSCNETVLSRKDGRPVSVDVTGVPVPYGEKTLVQWIFRDITGHKEIEEELRQTTEKYRHIFENTMLGIYHTTPEGQFIIANPAAARLLGYESPEDLIRSVEKVGTQIYVRPEDRDEVFRLMKDHGFVENFEARFRRKDGSVVWGSLNACAIRDEKGNILYIQGTSEDITGRKTTEEALLESNQRLRYVTNNLPNAMVYQLTAEPDGGRRFIYVSRSVERLNEVTVEEVLADAGVIYKQVLPEYLARVKEREEEALKNLATLNVTVLSRLPSGRLRWFEYNSTPRYQADGLLVWDGIEVDITERIHAEEKIRKAREELELRVRERTAELQEAYGSLKSGMEERRRLEEQLRQSQKMEAIGTLAGGIAHDFNNILAAIIGFAELVEEDLPPKSRSTPHIQRVLNAAFRGRDLVRQILAFSRKTELRREPLLFLPIVKETVQLLRASLPATVEIQLTTKAIRNTILAHPAELQQILMNLATNASSAMEEKGGTLGIHITNVDFQPDSPFLDGGTEPGEYVQLAVTDTGNGMEPYVMKRIFEPFFTTKRVGEGTGMGLAVVYGIVKSLGGTIAVESEPGAGSTFRVFLPVARTSEKSEGSAARVIPRGSERILFVDDEELLTLWGQTALERLGYAVTALTDSTEALNVFLADPAGFDLAILDQTMPKLTGLRLAKKLLTIRNNIPIILCTGHSDSVSPQKLEEAGIKEFLTKPLGRQALAEAIRRALPTVAPEA